MNITEADYRMFEIYAKEYKNLIKKDNNESITYIENKMKLINKELLAYVKELCKLDLEFNLNSSEIPDPVAYFIKNKSLLQSCNYVNNTNWVGFWKKCSGKDLEYFVSYLEYPIIYPKHENYIENKKDIIEVFKKETGFCKIPYGVKCAHIINEKYFK